MTAAQAAYEAYVARVGSTDFPFGDLPESVQEAWGEAARAVIRFTAAPTQDALKDTLDDDRVL